MEKYSKTVIPIKHLKCYSRKGMVQTSNGSSLSGYQRQLPSDQRSMHKRATARISCTISEHFGQGLRVDDLILMKINSSISRKGNATISKDLQGAVHHPFSKPSEGLTIMSTCTSPSAPKDYHSRANIFQPIKLADQRETRMQQIWRGREMH
jgi:hypothetical protein